MDHKPEDSADVAWPLGRAELDEVEMLEMSRDETGRIAWHSMAPPSPDNYREWMPKRTRGLEPHKPTATTGTPLDAIEPDPLDTLDLFKPQEAPPVPSLPLHAPLPPSTAADPADDTLTATLPETIAAPLPDTIAATMPVLPAVPPDMAPGVDEGDDSPTVAIKRPETLEGLRQDPPTEPAATATLRTVDPMAPEAVADVPAIDSAAPAAVAALPAPAQITEETVGVAPLVETTETETNAPETAPAGAASGGEPAPALRLSLGGGPGKAATTRVTIRVPRVSTIASPAPQQGATLSAPPPPRRERTSIERVALVGLGALLGGVLATWADLSHVAQPPSPAPAPVRSTAAAGDARVTAPAAPDRRDAQPAGQPAAPAAAGRAPASSSVTPVQPAVAKAAASESRPSSTAPAREASSTVVTSGRPATQSAPAAAPKTTANNPPSRKPAAAPAEGKRASATSTSSRPDSVTSSRNASPEASKAAAPSAPRGAGPRPTDRTQEPPKTADASSGREAPATGAKSSPAQAAAQPSPAASPSGLIVPEDRMSSRPIAETAAAAVSATPAAAPPAAAPTTAPPSEVLDPVKRYAAAYSRLDARAAMAAFPAANRDALAAAFSGIREQKLTLDRCQADVHEMAATVSCHGTLRYRPRVGEIGVRQGRWRFTLVRGADAWLIDSVDEADATPR